MATNDMVGPALLNGSHGRNAMSPLDSSASSLSFMDAPPTAQALDANESITPSQLDEASTTSSAALFHHSDYTIPTSNQRRRQRRLNGTSQTDISASPPSSVTYTPLYDSSSGMHQTRRLIFPHLSHNAPPGTFYHRTSVSSTLSDETNVTDGVPSYYGSLESTEIVTDAPTRLERNEPHVVLDPNVAWYSMMADGIWVPTRAPQSPPLQSYHHTDLHAFNGANGQPGERHGSNTSLHEILSSPYTTSAKQLSLFGPVMPTTPLPVVPHVPPNRNTHHAQSLLLGLAMAALWSSSNLMAPNLTVIAADFGYGLHNKQERDMYFGSILSLVTTVASIPLATMIGLATDNVVPTRPTLLVCVLLTGALSTLGTGQATLYWHVVVTRWLCGGCMAGSIPVAFSLVSDWFDVSGRNVACSGVTACMGLGVIAGQVYAGIVSTRGGTSWSHAFVVSAVLQALAAILCARYIHEPVRGGTEQAFQALVKAGIKVLPPIPPLTLPAAAPATTNTRWPRSRQAQDAINTYLLCHGPQSNATNSILLWQGFFSSVPWGVMFVFLNDFLLQERGFSESDATFLVAMFGLGCAAGGIVGGAAGHVLQQVHGGAWVPLFMSITTLLGIIPFVALLNSHFTNAHGWQGILYAGLGGLIASLPSVNVRPCLMNVNPPATRGRALTTANLLISLGRGVGPCCIPMIQRLSQYMGDDTRTDRKFAFNVTLVAFWIISAVQLLFLMKTLPRDQQAMEAELEQYAAHAIRSLQTNETSTTTPLVLHRDDSGTVGTDSGPDATTIAERMTSFDDVAAKETLLYVQAGFQELRRPFRCQTSGVSSRNSEMDLEEDDKLVTR